MTTFFAMVYILMVNANMFTDPFGDGSNPLGVSYGAIYIATAISAVVGTVLAGILANLPLAQASGMGLNAFFVYTVCIGFGLSYANALVLILMEGVVFILLTVTGLREKIFDSLPDCVRVAIPAGIGLFIALLIPGCATAAALIYVGLLMTASVKNIEWDNFKTSVPAFLTLAVMPFTYNISYGIAFGLLSYIIISVFCGDGKKIKGSSWVICMVKSISMGISSCKSYLHVNKKFGCMQPGI